MRKLGRLWQNECIKIFHGPAVYIFVAVLFVIMLALSSLDKNFNKFEDRNTCMNPPKMLQEQKDLLAKLEDVQGILKSDRSLTAEQYEMNSAPYYRARAAAQILEAVIRENLDICTYKYDIYNRMFVSLGDVFMLEELPEYLRGSDYDEHLTRSKEEAEELSKLLHGGFSEYLAYQRKAVEETPDLSAELRKSKLDTLSLWDTLDCNAQGEPLQAEAYFALNQLIIDRDRLLTTLTQGYDSYEHDNRQLLTPEMRRLYEDKLAVVDFRIEHKRYRAPDSLLGVNSYAAMQAAGVYLIIFFMISLSGAMVAAEMQSGSIKSLIISPTRRYKIFLAKLLALFSTALALVLVLFVLLQIVSALFNGVETAGTNYVLVQNGLPYELGVYTYRFQALLWSLVEIMFYSCFALLCSTLIRNTAAALGMGFSFLFIGQFVGQILPSLRNVGNIEWIYLYNFNFVERLLPVAVLDGTNSIRNLLGLNRYLPMPELWYSFVSLGLLLLGMVWAAMESFVKRDI